MVDKQEGVDILLTDRNYAQLAIQTQLLNDIAGILYEQLAVAKDAIPDIIRKYEFNVTDSAIEITSDTLPSLPWITMTLYNDGADPVHVYINSPINDDAYSILSPGDPPFESGDTFKVDMKSPKIKRVYLVCDAGETATVRIVATMKEYGVHTMEGF